MTNHVLGVYWAPGHYRQSDLDYMRQLQPPAIRILDPDVQQLIDAHKAAPNAFILPRDWALSEQKDDMKRDPAGTGKRHANDWRNKVNQWRLEAQRRGQPFPGDEQIVVVGINEPAVWEMLSQTVKYNAVFLEECKRLGLRACALNLSVGWPANTGDNTPPNWEPYSEVYAAIVRGNHYLCLHEYWYRTGPEDGWGWHAGRLLKCPWDVPIIVGECGVDNYVDRARWDREGGNRGWRGHISPDEYAQQMCRYIERLDRRVVAVLPFLTDYRSREWESFDTAEAHDALLRVATVQVPAQPPSQPTPVIAQPPQPAQKEGSMGIIDPFVGQTLIKVESGGRAFGPNGRPLIRFETHIFRQKLNNDALWKHYFRHGSPVWTGQEYYQDGAWKPLHTGNQADEYAALSVAERINRKAAYESISMGLGQIMGFNHARVGYPSAEAMFNAFAQSEANQVMAFINFFLSDPTLAQAVRNKDWRTIARLFNGPGNVDNVAPLLEQTYAQLAGGN